MFSKTLASTALIVLGLAISSAPAHAGTPSRNMVPEVDDQVLVFSGDAYVNEMGFAAHTGPHADGIIAILIGLYRADERPIMAPLGSTKGS